MAKEAGKDKEKAPAAAPAGTAAPAAKKGSPLKVGIVLLGVLLLEGGTVFVTMLMSGGPHKAEAKHMVAPEDAEGNKLVELLVSKDQFSNQRSGRVMLYDTEIFITVRKKDGDKLKKQVEAMQAQLSTDIATVFRRAEPAQFLEPTLATLTRQVKAVLDERLGKDAEGQPLAQETLIRRCIGFQAG
jgi:hypothetical protein